MSENTKKISWTDEQRLAIETKNKTLLVSAAAGSGKTATLTERIIRQITDDGADLSAMLIVTFTKASAADLKLKIFKAISNAISLAKSPSELTALSNQLTKLNSAHISTIDSFYFDVVKSNFSEAGVSPTFRIIDTEEYKLISKRIMNETIDELYESDKNFPLFVECFTTIKSSKGLCDTFLEIHSTLSSTIEGIDFLNTCAKKAERDSSFELMQSEYGAMLKETTVAFFTHYLKLFEQAIAISSENEVIQASYGDSLLVDYNFCRDVLCEINSDTATYKKIKDMLDAFTPQALGKISAKKATEESVFVKNMRKSFQDKRKAFSEKFYSSSPTTVERAMKETAQHISTLYRLLSLFEEKISAQKKQLDVLTFNDVCRKAHSLLVQNGKPTATAKALSEKFSDIYIDEYQDVSPIQDDIFCAISTPTGRFMVGDIKQSIYKFRGAEPSLFSKYRNKFPDISNASDSDSATVFMSSNFRCDENIINFTNLVCSGIFKSSGGCVNYQPKDDLVFSKKDKSVKEKESNVEVAVISVPNSKPSDDSDDENDFIAMEWESEYIASQIEKLIGKEKNNDGSPIKPSDIAILFRSKRISPYISAALRRRGIKSAETDSTQYFENDDVLMMLCILNTIDNPERDIYLAGTLRSPLFHFTADDILTIRRTHGEPLSLFGGLLQYMRENNDSLSKKCKDFYDTLTVWQDISSSLSIDKFLLALFNTERFIASGILSSQGSDGEGGNVLLLYDYARSFQGNGFKGVYEFIEYLNSLIEENQSFPASSKRDAPDRVSLMTIHKSKGLEFPVCFLCTAGKRFNNEDSKKSLILSYPYGIAMKLADSNGFARVATPMRELLLERVSTESAEEEIRVLYVALTRARERLFVVATTNAHHDTLSTKAKLSASCLDRYAVLSSSTSFIDWILIALNEEIPEYVDLKLLTPEDIQLTLEPDETDASSVSPDKELYEKLVKSFEFKYEFSKLSQIPSKLSVSKLYPDILDADDGAVELFASNDSDRVPEFFTQTAKSPSPAERGTATHLFLQFCNFEYAMLHGAKEELERLCSLKYLPQNTPSLIYLDELEKFAEGDFIKEILSSKRIIREQRFNISLPISDFTQDPELIEKSSGRSLAVQGVIDLILVDKDGNVRLYDYKTDRLSKNELENPTLAKRKLQASHAEQLSYYAKAVELMFGKPCDSVQIYSTHSGMLYNIDIRK